MIERNKGIDLLRIAALAAGGLVTAWVGSALANSLGPPLAHTGDFGQAACNESGCHAGNGNFNAAGGSLVLTGVPAQYETGKTYTITVTINKSGQSRWGFECSARQVVGAAQAGNLVATDRTRTAVDVESGIQYIHHEGLPLSGTGPKSWSFNWTAPATAVGAVRFSCAGNAANGDGNNTGDFIYTTTAATNPFTLTFLTTLYYPRLVTTDNDFTGIAVANLDTSDATLRFTSYDKNGTPLAGSSITNPKEQSLAKATQLPVIDTQVFGDGLTTKKPVGWFKIESTVRKIVGFFLMFDANLTTMDGADVSSRTLTSFVFPEVEDLGFTQLHVANPNSSSTGLAFDLVRTDGSIRASATRSVNANGAVAESLTELFPGATPAGSDYVQARVTSGQGVVPFELLGKTDQYVEGINGQDPAGAATTLYSPQYVVGGSFFRTTLSVINVDTSTATVTLKFIKDDGTQIGTTQTRTIPAKGKLSITDQAFFLNAGGTQTQGYVVITSSGPKLTGSVVFGDPGRTTFSSSLPLVSSLQTDVVFSQLASNETFFTGLAILNPSGNPVDAEIEAFDAIGTRVADIVVTIGAGNRVSKLLTEFFKDKNFPNESYSSGYFQVHANQPVASFALFGTNSLSVLSAVPPQVVP